MDPALDEERFCGRLHALPWVCFTGRVDQLRRLATWMDSHNDLADPSGRDDGGGAGLRVVTGNSGVGKSALLGVLVCAAHPRLRESTQQLWWVAAHRPSQNPHLAAVHARQRGVAEITASLGRQPLGSYGARYPGPEVFPGGEVFPADARTPAELIVAIAGLAVRPVIVLDALDERTTARPGIEGHRMTGHVDVVRRSPQVEADIGRDRLCNPGDTYAEYQAPTQLHRSSTTRVDVVAQRTETVDAGPGSPDPAVESFRAPAFTHAVTETGNAQADLVTVTAYVVAEIRSTRSSRSGSSGSLVIAILRSKTNQTGTDRELVVLPAPRGPSAARSLRFAPGARPPIAESRDPGWRTCRARRPTRAARPRGSTTSTNWRFPTWCQDRDQIPLPAEADHRGPGAAQGQHRQPHAGTPTAPRICQRPAPGRRRPGRPRGGPYTAHSLRAGFVSYAHLRASDRAIAHQTRHRSLASVGTYVWIHQAWEDNAATMLGL